MLSVPIHYQSSIFFPIYFLRTTSPPSIHQPGYKGQPKTLSKKKQGHTSKHQHNMELVVGPVIGTVTATTARILIEVNDNAEILVVVTDGQGNDTRSNKPCTAGIPSLFHFEGLSQNTGYSVRVHGYEHVTSGFWTFGTNPVDMNFAIVSCNKLRWTMQRVKPGGDVWSSLQSMVRQRKLHMVIHLGDQVYADTDYEATTQGKVKTQVALQYCTFLQALHLLNNTPREDWEAQRSVILNLYREEYRKTWGYGPTRFTLANVCNLMVYDDHEIRDDIGDRPEERDPSSATRFIAECGRRVAMEYQRVLHDDVDLSHPTRVPVLKRENHIIHSVGEYAIVIADCRGARFFNQEPGDKHPFVTDRQFADLERAMEPGGILERCRMMIFATQVPLVFLSRRLTEIIAKRIDDFEGMWEYKDHQREQIMMLNLLHRWTTQKQGRDIILCGGDVHIGALTKLYHNGKPWARQMITGPISNQTLNKFVLRILNVAHNIGNTLPGGLWAFRHRRFIAARNFGIIRASLRSKDRAPRADCSLVVGTKRRVHEIHLGRPADSRGGARSARSYE